MVEPTLEFLGERLDAIQAELRELKFSIDVDRRTRDADSRALITELGAALGTMEVKLDGRMHRIETQLTDFQALVMPALEKLLKAVTKEGR